MVNGPFDVQARAGKCRIFSDHFAFTVGCYCYFWSNLFNVDVNYSNIYLYNYKISLKCIDKNLVNLGYSDSLNFWVINE